ncbi:hypothetical protein DAPPUDRAFT_239073 [Daphnia pulex]|uniref:Uncharacterized protein n=1 Tax=Daphnia pulex TaxID=6669 RepID=E9G891_DAPPU|nr:hypothetical protein DAPPUDRAFT_239073 [Daphnia pulex]|eukprot:EFX84313.1 hypothetical protein DAPPUDRAFT_239073 [Daphnia pulex]
MLMAVNEEVSSTVQIENRKSWATAKIGFGLNTATLLRPQQQQLRAPLCVTGKNNHDNSNSNN